MADQHNTLAGREVYFQGDRARLTGAVETLHGGTFYEAIGAEGEREGQTLWLSPETNFDLRHLLAGTWGPL